MIEPQKWHPASAAPKNAWPVSICCTVTCACEKGAQIVFHGARRNGQWVINTGGFEHSFEIESFYVLPQPPKPAFMCN